MKIEAVDFFYLSMPEVTDAADGSQDALLVRVRGGGMTGWGECEAAPLPSIAAFVCPKSHGVCRPVGETVLGQRLEGAGDIARIAAEVRYNSMDLLQAAHTFSGVEMALWDLLGQHLQAPAWALLGQKVSHGKRPYASLLFGDDPQVTLERARQAAARGFRAVKFGWGPIGRSTAGADADHFMAAREGIGAEADLMVDVGQIFRADVEGGAARLPALDAAGVLWFEEPFEPGALSAWAELASKGASVRLAGGEAAHEFHMASHLIDYGRVGYIQIDCGRIGGLGPARKVAELAAAKGVTYVNHTFTSHLALSASLQPYADMEESRICEYPADPQPLATAITANHLQMDAAGEICAPEAPGLGMTIAPEALRPYLVEAEIRVGKTLLYRTPEF